MPILGALVGFFVFSGTALAVPTAVSAPAAPITPAYTVALTGYNAVPAQTDGNPLVTASGAYSNPEVVAARSQDLGEELPFGTVIAIDGPADAQNNCGFGVVGDTIGYRVIADTMNQKFTDRVDVLFPKADTRANNRAVVLGVCNDVTIRVVGHVDINHMPKTQAELAAIIAGKDGVALK